MKTFSLFYFFFRKPWGEEKGVSRHRRLAEGSVLGREIESREKKIGKDLAPETVFDTVKEIDQIISKNNK